MERYSRITEKNQREIVLLRAFPCAWGKCTFCDYIEDNGRDREEMVQENRQVLSRVTGAFGVLEVINSGSCFELPEETLEDIKEIAQRHSIGRLIFESHWIYRKRLNELREYFRSPLPIKWEWRPLTTNSAKRYSISTQSFKVPRRRRPILIPSA